VSRTEFLLQRDLVEETEVKKGVGSLNWCPHYCELELFPY